MTKEKDLTNIICKKCGLTANSKCPFCRNIFYIDSPTRSYRQQYEVSILENLIWEDKVLTPEGYKEGYKERHITLRLRPFTTPAKEGEKEEDTLTDAHMVGLLNYMGTSDQLIIALCDHRWEFKPGKVSSIDCGHGSRRKRRKA